MDKFDYWQSLVERYQAINEEIKPFEIRTGIHRVILPEDHEHYRQLLKDLDSVIDAMGTEFSELFTRHKNTKMGK